MKNISETLKRAMFNGKVDKGEFRRGLWDVDELRKANIANKPDVPNDAIKIHYSDGCIAFYIRKDKAMVVNKNNRLSETTQQVMQLFRDANPAMQVVETDELAGAVRSGGGAARDWDAVFKL